MSSLPDELLRALECPVCLEVPKQGPIQQCNNGHLLCRSCHAKLLKCPVCDSNLGAVATRSLLADLVLDFIPKVCKFKVHGCDKEMITKLRTEHEVICPFREVNCPNQNCLAKVSLANLLKHTKGEHTFVVVDSGSTMGAMKVKQGEFLPSSYELLSWIPRQLNFQLRHFFTCFNRFPGQEMWKIWIYFAGTPEEAKNFKFRLCFLNAERDEVSFTGTVVSMDTPRNEVIKSHAILALPDATAKLFWKNDKIAYKIVIKQIEQKDTEGTIHNVLNIEPSDAQTRKRKKSTSESFTNQENLIQSKDTQ